MDAIYKHKNQVKFKKSTMKKFILLLMLASMMIQYSIAQNQFNNDNLIEINLKKLDSVKNCIKNNGPNSKDIANAKSLISLIDSLGMENNVSKYNNIVRNLFIKSHKVNITNLESLYKVISLDYGGLGRIYDLEGNSTKSLPCFFYEMQAADSSRDSLALSWANYNYAIGYNTERKDPSGFIKYIFDATRMFEYSKEPLGITNSWLLMGILYSNLNQKYKINDKPDSLKNI